MSQCITCANLNLRDAGPMARFGFGKCKLRAKWEFISTTYERECKAHRPAEADVVAARIKWNEKKP